MIDPAVECAFWRRAAELALRSMSDAEDELERARHVGRMACHLAIHALTHGLLDDRVEDIAAAEGWLEYLADDSPAETGQTMPGFHIVETETER